VAAVSDAFDHRTVPPGVTPNIGTATRRIQIGAFVLLLTTVAED
jgi:hypothetical protein